MVPALPPGGVTVTATREREPVMGVPSTVAVVDSIELAQRPTVSLADHLLSTPGVEAPARAGLRGG